MRCHKYLMLSDIQINTAVLLISKKGHAQTGIALSVSLGNMLKVNCASATQQGTF